MTEFTLLNPELKVAMRVMAKSKRSAQHIFRVAFPRIKYGGMFGSYCLTCEEMKEMVGK